VDIFGTKDFFGERGDFLFEALELFDPFLVRSILLVFAAEGVKAVLQRFQLLLIFCAQFPLDTVDAMEQERRKSNSKSTSTHFQPSAMTVSATD